MEGNEGLEPQNLEPITTLDDSGGIIDEPQPVQAMPQEPEPPKKILGEFDDEVQAKIEVEKLKAFREAVIKDRDVQALVAARQEAARRAEAQKIGLQQEEAAILENYVEAMNAGKPDQAFVGLVRSVKALAARDAEIIVQRKLQEIAEPLNAKRQLLENNEWAALHPVADETTLLATELGKIGWKKADVAKLLNTVVEKASGGKTKVSPIRSSQRGGSMLSPDSGGYAPVNERDLDTAIDAWWSEAGYPAQR